MSIDRIQYLVERYLDGSCTAAEKTELARLIEQAPDDGALQQALERAWQEHEPLEQMPDQVSDRIMTSLFGHPAAPARRVHTLKRWWWAAAAVLLPGAGLFYMNRPVHTQVVTSHQQRYKNEVQPGGNKALLVLADGSVIALDSAANGMLTQQGNVKVMKLANGRLVYNAGGKAGQEQLYNTMSTPRGGTYQLTLPDGTDVWLNAASSITYPIAFAGKERSVSITGEVYFEVAENAHQPFKVTAGDMEVDVLGTHFNINAYPDEKVIRTTLLEGAVKVSAGTAPGTRLQPGQQARLAPGGTMRVVPADTEEAIAWKNGFFQFTDADMPTVMRQLEKWYNVQVTYEGDIPERSFGGGIQRSLPLSKVLGILEENNVKFRIEGRNIIVMKPKAPSDQ